MKSVLDPSFRYVNSQSTDIRKTFARIRRQLKDAGSLTKERLVSPSKVVQFRSSIKSG